MATRREVLAVTAATVTLPMLQSALGTMRGARAAASAPATAPATAPARGAARGASRTAPDEKAGWFATTLKPADLKDNEFTDVTGHAIVLTRQGTDISANTSKCTHQGCQVHPKAGEKIMTCPCHMAQYDLTGKVIKGPAKNDLVNYAIRVNADGLIEVDPGTKPVKGDKDFSVAAPAA